MTPPRRHIPLWARKTLVILALSLVGVWFMNGLLESQPVAWLILGAVVTMTVIVPVWNWFHEPSRQEQP